MNVKQIESRIKFYLTLASKKHAKRAIRKSRSKLLSVTRKPKRRLIRVANMEIGRAFHLGRKGLLFQLALRPRIKLFVAFIVLLAFTFLGTNHAVQFLKPKEKELKINGRTIVASQDEDAQKVETPEIEQSVVTHLSPFNFKYPVADGVISQGYSEYHRANDIAAPYDSPIHPLGEGMVEFAGFEPDGKGNVVIIDHGNGLKTLYAHMDRITVGIGNKVQDDTTIGTIGLTGHTTGPHVHVEVYDQGIAIDPQSILP